MEQVTDLAQARRRIAQLEVQLAEAEKATNRWKLNYFDMLDRNRILEAAIKVRQAAKSD